ncbi:hypothetical protein [Xylophilus sp. GOD-11R]|uniref:hypothetical protein n=1 Tax=Xylophilus sp. GOD-11R TaxID=3089814 RepID=UPI00298C49E2|nr:hypothetical protein [Xylophilus sp. GOD-11R]WPB55213.1 hypothetical protein R9X41_13730 [Xylophilus sp. GOD-11R]
MLRIQEVIDHECEPMSSPAEVNRTTGKRGFSMTGQPLQFALRLADLVEQRPADVHRCSELNIREGALSSAIGKTPAKPRIAIEGDLTALI